MSGNGPADVLIATVGVSSVESTVASVSDGAHVVLRMKHLGTDVRDPLWLDLVVSPANVTDRERAYWRSYDVGSRRLVETARPADLERLGYAL